MLGDKKLGFALIASLSAILFVTCQEIQIIKPGCQKTCGKVNIPYPFGIGKECALDDSFLIHCNHTFHPPKPFLANFPGSLPIIDISLDGYLCKHTYVAYDCYNNSSQDNWNEPFSSLPKNYHFSTRNKFTVLGCDTKARIYGSIDGRNYSSGCISICTDKSMIIDGSCSGIGCCQTSIPKHLSYIEMLIYSYDNHTKVRSFNPCSYAFIADPTNFKFSISTLAKMPEQFPAVLDWAIGDKPCAEALKNRSSYACKKNSECRNSDNNPGYRCFCKKGYTGNPYVHGCVDVDECNNTTQNDCSYKCKNTDGNYTCSCPSWFSGDGKRNGEGCFLNKHKIFLVLIGGGILLILIVAGSLILYRYRRKKLESRLKEKFFKQNGGYMLLDRMSRKELGPINTIKIFKSEELEEATDNFSEARICGRGGFGTVYQGHLSNGDAIAIKKSKFVDQDQVEQFINEITILSQVHHRNVVRFLGCCLETPVPLLVYEFIRNGTIHDHLHNNNGARITWQTRLKIAAEIAGVLAYLHTDISPQIIHRDIKPTNILLDDDYTPKVSDFGASRLVPKNVIDMCTMVQGTIGYLDPEYLHTSILTDKSDVYSFGVVLIELLTGLKVVSFERAENNRSLVTYFLSLTKEDKMSGIVDKVMVNEENIEVIQKVVRIAKMCVKVNGEERPTMKEVALEFQTISKVFKHIWDTSDPVIHESGHLLHKVPHNNWGNSSNSVEYSSIENEYVPLNIADGR